MILKHVPGIIVCSPPAWWASGPVGKLFSPLPCKHVCIPSMLPCFCLYGDLSTDLLIHHRPHLHRDQPVNESKLCVVFSETLMLCVGCRARCWSCRKLWKLRCRETRLEPSSVPGSDCRGHNQRAWGGGTETQWSPAGQTPIAREQKNKQRRTQKALFLISSPTTDAVAPSQFFPLPRRYLARLGLVSPGLLFPDDPWCNLLFFTLFTPPLLWCHAKC